VCGWARNFHLFAPALEKSSNLPGFSLANEASSADALPDSPFDGSAFAASSQTLVFHFREAPHSSGFQG
jgi:hypothetical protein